MAQKASPRATIGCLGLVAIVVVVLLVAARSHGGSNPAWSAERYNLVTDAQNLTTAEQAGNGPHAAQIRESILKNCHTAAGLSPDSSDDHRAVQSLCQTLGITVP